MQHIDTSAFDNDIQGRNIPAGSVFRDVLGKTPTLLVFLRHFGCIFCRETVADLKKIHAEDPDYPAVLFFYQGTPHEGDAFFGAVWPEARAVADIPRRFYNAFGIERGGMREMFGPAVWACGVRATAKGHTIGMKTGDPWTMPGLFLVHESRILWQHDFKHAGDHPDFYQIKQHLSEMT